MDLDLNGLNRLIWIEGTKVELNGLKYTKMDQVDQMDLTRPKWTELG